MLERHAPGHGAEADVPELCDVVLGHSDEASGYQETIQVGAYRTAAK